MSDAPHKVELHIGDYLRDTEDLSLLQHGIYLRLMLWYYSTAKPLPNDLERINRRIGAMSREEKHAAESVLGEFFQLREGKWWHKRIEEELGRWGVATETARNNAKKRWEEHRKNKQLVNADAVETQSDGNASPDACLLPSAFSLQPSTKVKTNVPAVRVLTPPREDVPYQQIVDLYHELLPELPRVAKLTTTRRSHIRARWKGRDAEDLADWRAYFERVRTSRFLLGLSTPTPGRRTFAADFDWLINEANFAKVLEGKYE